MRILISTTPGAGHVNPVVPLARSLVELGHQIVWVTSASGCRAVAALGFDAREAGLDVAERTSRLIQLHPGVMAAAPRARRPIMFAGGFAEVAAPAMVDDLLATVRDVEPDLVVHEVAELAAPAICATFGIPLVTVAFSGALPAPVRLALRPAIEPLWTRFGVAVPEDFGFGTHAYLHPFPPVFGQRPPGLRVRDVRPTSDDRSSGSSAPQWLDALGRDRPLVYVTFGTEVSHLMPWAMVVAGIAAAGVDAVVTTGHGVDAAALSAQLPEDAAGRVRIEQYVPQSFVAPRAQVVVSHGGAGTVLAAAAGGVAQIVLPIAADQFDNADAVTGAGVGIELDPSRLSSATLAHHIAEIVGRADLRDAATRVAEEIAAMLPPHDVAAQLVA